VTDISEQHPHSGNWLREIVFGMNDGLVTTLVFIMAVSSVATSHLVLIAMGEVVAGGISMALGGYLSSRTEQDILDHRIATEREEIRSEPDEEREELRTIYHRKGLQDALVDRVVEDLTKDEGQWLRSMVHDELGIVEGSGSSPWIEGILIGGSFMLGGIAPVVPLLLSLPHPQIMAFVFTALMAIALGTLKSRYSLKTPARNSVEFLAIITLGTLAGVVVGHFLHAL